MKHLESNPIKVVGYGHPTLYTVENTATGEVAARSTVGAPRYAGGLRQWTTPKGAQYMLDAIVSGRAKTNWVKCRPVRNADGFLYAT